MNEFIVIMGLSISLNFLLMAVLAVVIARLKNVERKINRVQKFLSKQRGGLRNEPPVCLGKKTIR